ncbi:MAG: nicotinamide mononucleotide deamidase-related protein [Desulfurococcales archaeon]
MILTLEGLQPPSNSNAWIINFGSEILTGFTQNTNATFLARKLSFLGYYVKRIMVVPDAYEEAGEEIQRGIEKKLGLLITTGGLGPTYDDSTLEMISKVLSLPLEVNPEAFEMVKIYYERLGESLTDERVKMAKMPNGAIPIRNPVGAAPGSILRVETGYIISLPGVPSEMRAMFESAVEPILARWSKNKVSEEILEITGIMESSLAPYINAIAKEFPNTYIKTHPKGTEGNPIVVVQIFASSKNEAEMNAIIAKVKEKIFSAVNKLGGSIEQKGGKEST